MMGRGWRGGIKEAKSREIVHVKPVRKLELSVGERRNRWNDRWKVGKVKKKETKRVAFEQVEEGWRDVARNVRNCVFIWMVSRGLDGLKGLN